MRVQVIFASFLMLTISLAGCITDSTVEQITDDITEVLGCMDESALNFDESATTSSDLCLSEEQLLLAEEVFWSSWDSDAINNATEPVGYRLMLEETSENENESRSLDVQEVFSSDYYNQEIEYRGCLNPNTMLTKSDNSTNNECMHWTCESWCECMAAGDNGLGVTVGDVDGDVSRVLSCHYSSQTVFDNVVQVEKFSDGEWDNYSMNTTSTYEEFRNRLEHGPGIRSTNHTSTFSNLDELAGRSENGNGDCNDSKPCERPPMFPSIADTEFNNTDFSNLDVSIGAEGRSQTIYYFARDTSTGNEIEVMGEMTENGFKITEYCNEIANTNISIIGSYMTPTDYDAVDNNTVTRSEGGIENMTVTTVGPWRVSARIILLEVDGNDMRFEEYDYDEPVNYRSGDNVSVTAMNDPVFRAIPFYFEVIPDLDTNETQNKSAEGRKGLNAVNVKVVIAGPSGPYGMEGDLSDYRLVISNCTLDSKTTDSSNNTVTAARSEGNNSNSSWNGDSIIYGSDGNTCTDIVEYDLADILVDNLTICCAPLGDGVQYVDADSSGTLSEGDRFEFSDNNTIFDAANMLRLFSISADGYSDENINPSSEMSAVHEGAMNSIRNVRSVAPDDPPPPVRAVDHNSARSNKGG